MRRQTLLLPTTLPTTSKATAAAATAAAISTITTAPPPPPPPPPTTTTTTAAPTAGPTAAPPPRRQEPAEGRNAPAPRHYPRWSVRGKASGQEIRGGNILTPATTVRPIGVGREMNREEARGGGRCRQTFARVFSCGCRHTAGAWFLSCGHDFY